MIITQDGLEVVVEFKKINLEIESELMKRLGADRIKDFKLTLRDLSNEFNELNK